MGVLTHFPAVPTSTRWLVINQAQDPEHPAPASVQTTPAFPSQLGLRRQSIKYTGPVYLCVCFLNETRSFHNNAVVEFEDVRQLEKKLFSLCQHFS